MLLFLVWVICTCYKSLQHIKSTLLIISHITIGKYAFDTDSHIGTSLLLGKFANINVNQHYILHMNKTKQARTFTIPACCYSFFHPYCLQYGPVTPTSANQHGEKPACVNNFVQTIFAIVFSLRISRQYIPRCLAKCFSMNFLTSPCCLKSGRMFSILNVEISARVAVILPAHDDKAYGFSFCLDIIPVGKRSGRMVFSFHFEILFGWLDVLEWNKLR